MNVKDCRLGLFTPHFFKTTDIDGIRTEFDKSGLVFFEDVDEAALVKLSRQLGTIVKPRNEIGTAGSGVSNIRCAPDLVGKGYSSEELFFHTDRSGWNMPPRLLLTTLKTKSTTGGESLVVDGQAVRAHIQQTDPSLYSLLTNAKHTSFRSDDHIFTPRPIFDEKTGLIRVRYDDGIQFSASLVDRLTDFKKNIFEHARAVALEPGQSYLVDNHRYLHGRTSFTGSRELLRVLAHPHHAINAPHTNGVATPAPIVGGGQRRKLILFDVDGTLCRSEALSIDAYYTCLSDVTGRTITHENTKVNLHGQTDLSLLRDILAYHQVAAGGGDEKELNGVVEQFFKEHPRYLEAGLARGLPSTACPGVWETLEWLGKERQCSQASNFVIGLLTGNSRANALAKITAAGLNTGVFDLDVSTFGDVHANRLGLVDSAMELFARKFGGGGGVKQRLDPAEDVLLVGDTPLDVECAQLAGCIMVAVATGHYAMEQLRVAEGSIVVESLPRAHDFIERFLTA